MNWLVLTWWNYLHTLLYTCIIPVYYSCIYVFMIHILYVHIILSLLEHPYFFVFYVFLFQSNENCAVLFKTSIDLCYMNNDIVFPFFDIFLYTIYNVWHLKLNEYFDWLGNMSVNGDNYYTLYSMIYDLCKSNLERNLFIYIYCLI